MDKQNEVLPYHKMNEVLVHVITWMHLQNMQCERSQAQKSHILSDSISMRFTYSLQNR